MAENLYQRKLIKKLHDRFPGCMVLKNNPADQQGVPDLLILFNKTWGALEVKDSAAAKIQPNQMYFYSNSMTQCRSQRSSIQKMKRRY